MKLKLAVIALLLMASLLTVGGQTENVILLNLRGTRQRGPVRFDHQAHQGRLNPDPNWPYKASVAAACAGCHHSRNAQGIPQLWKCTACHQNEGKGAGENVNQRCGRQCDPAGNPTNCQCDELYFERAFHDSCIGCHRATNEKESANRAPVTCNGCHGAK